VVSTTVESVSVSEIVDEVSGRAGHTGQLRTTLCRPMSKQVYKAKQKIVRLLLA